MIADDVHEAFRRGARGNAWADGEASPGLAEAAAPFAAGPNEAMLLGVGRMPGLKDARAAYETGRALRMIIRLFDRAGASADVGRQFVDNLAAAIMTEHMRGRPLSWGAADTADMFLEMYARILRTRPSELTRVRRAIMDYAVREPTKASSPARFRAIFRRRPPSAGHPAGQDA